MRNSDKSEAHDDKATTDHGEYVELIKRSDGKLEIRLTDEGREEFAEFEHIRNKCGIDAAMLELLFDHLANGWQEIQPEEVCALTSALLFSDDVERDENGELLDCGKVYWNPAYAVMDEIRELRERGFVLFASA